MLLAKDVDHGKTSLLDYIRGTTLAKREAGLITQHLCASEVPLFTIKEICGNLLDRFNLKFTIPGLLFIDSPGHAAFANLRKRGGSIADLAILVIDINQGIQPQTKEAIQILKTFKVPFIIAANKVDLINGWKPHSKIFIENINKQLHDTKEQFDKLFYRIVGDISTIGFNSNFYNKVEDYRKEIAIIPLSAKTGEGIAELLALLAGLAQRFLQDRLEIDENASGKGTILEIKEEKGIGTIADVILYEGMLSKDDYIAVGGLNEVVETKIRALLKPLPLSEIRDQKSSFSHVDSVHAATGVRVVALDLDKATPGSPLISAKTKEELESRKEEVLKEVSEVLIETDQTGIILKCDTLGSLEAVSKMIQDKGYAIKSASIGRINKQDIMMAKSVAETEPLDAFVLGFNVKIDDEAKKLAVEYKVPVIINEVVYKMIEDYEAMLENKRKQLELEKLQGLIWPAKFSVLSGFTFRQCNPAVFGIEVLGGKLKPGIELMNSECVKVGEVKAIEDQGVKLEEIGPGQRVAVSANGITIGRNVKEGEVLYSKIGEDNFRTLKSRKELLTKSEVDVLKEIAEMQRKKNQVWGI